MSLVRSGEVLTEPDEDGDYDPVWRNLGGRAGMALKGLPQHGLALVHRPPIGPRNVIGARATGPSAASAEEHRSCPTCSKERFSWNRSATAAAVGQAAMYHRNARQQVGAVGVQRNAGWRLASGSTNVGSGCCTDPNASGSTLAAADP